MRRNPSKDLAIAARAVSRRTFIRTLATAVAASATASLGAPRALAQSASPQQARLEKALAEIARGRAIRDGAGRVKLETPTIAENGAVVPIAVEVAESSPAVKAIYVVAERNPVPVVARFDFPDDGGPAYVATNIRLAGSAPVRAIAELADGTLLQVANAVKVTIGGCGG